MRKKGRNLLCLLVVPIMATYCGGSDDGGGGSGPLALVVTTDYQSGALTLVGRDLVATKNILTVHSDAVCRYDKITTRPYLISRFGADAIEVLDAANFSVTKEYSTGSGSNPQDILPISAERAYISLYAEDSLKVVNPITGAELGTVDLSNYADSDGVPEAAWMEKANDKAFVALQRLSNFMPSDKSTLLVLEGATGKVLKEIVLSATNPFGKVRYNQKLGKLVLSEMGSYGAKDGGVELIDLAQLQAEGLVVDEEALGGDVQDAVVLDENRGWAVVAVDAGAGASNTRVVAFNPKEGKVTATLHQGSGFSHGLLELSPDGKQLWVTDRSTTKPGLRIFDTASGQELSSSPIDVGLPPFMVCFLD